MSNKKKSLALNVETLVLVAVWETPFIFQGCIKITELHQDNRALFFFRCQSKHQAQQDILEDYFSSDDYEFTHLYHESGSLCASDSETKIR